MYTKSILITGGTGSFGTAFCLYLQKNNLWPRRLAILSRDWVKQAALREKLGDPPNTSWFIGDVRDYNRLLRAFDGVDTVIHAAAMKEIVSCEYNPREAMLTNVNGTQNVLDAAINCGVEKTLLISTDKAVEPVNFYGKTKALAEGLFIQGNAYANNKNSWFSVARYGNVIGSQGSVVEVYKRLIANGAVSLPVTDRRMTRFWYRMEDAIRFVFFCLENMRGGEIFVPKIPSIRILDLVEAFGREWHEIGIRPGEKLHECLIPEAVSHLTREFEDYYLIEPTIDFREGIEYEGRRVGKGFRYDSERNERFLTVDEIGKL
jgi:UDP-N-acetylglucosamine 4,6-dehydratase